jgi:hypothetical protein
MMMKNHRKQKVADWVAFRDEYKKLSLTALPMLLAWVILILFSYFWNGPVPTIVLSSMFFLAGFMGIIIIVRREIPAVLFTITGAPAIVEGSIVTIFFWGSAAYMILRGLL